MCVMFFWGCVSDQSEEEIIGEVGHSSDDIDGEWESIINSELDENRESDGVCYCTSTSQDPDCDYLYYSAADICNLGYNFEDEDDYAWVYRGQIENHNSSNELYIECAIPANYYNYEGYSSDDIKQVVVYARNRYVGDYDIDCDLRSVGMMDTSWQWEDDCVISAASTYMQRCEMEGFTVDWSDPLLVLSCEIPRLYNSTWSDIRGFRVCYDR